MNYPIYINFSVLPTFFKTKIGRGFSRSQWHRTSKFLSLSLHFYFCQYCPHSYLWFVTVLPTLWPNWGASLAGVSRFLSLSLFIHFFYFPSITFKYQPLNFTYFMTKLGRGFSRSQWHRIGGTFPFRRLATARQPPFNAFAPPWSCNLRQIHLEVWDKYTLQVRQIHL